MQFCGCFHPPRAISEHGSDIEHDTQAPEWLDSEFAASAATEEGHCFASISFAAAKCRAKCDSPEPDSILTAKLAVGYVHGEPRVQVLITVTETDRPSAWNAAATPAAAALTRVEQTDKPPVHSGRAEASATQLTVASCMLSASSSQAAMRTGTLEQNPHHEHQKLLVEATALAAGQGPHTAKLEAFCDKQDTENTASKQSCTAATDAGQTAKSTVAVIPPPLHTVQKLRKVFEQHNHIEQNSKVLAIAANTAAARSEAVSDHAANTTDIDVAASVDLVAAGMTASTNPISSCRTSSRLDPGTAAAESEAGLQPDSSMLSSQEHSSSTPCVWERVLSASRLQQLLDERSTTNVAAAVDTIATQAGSTSSYQAECCLQEAQDGADLPCASCTQCQRRSTMLAPSDDGSSPADPTHGHLSDDPFSLAVLDAPVPYVEYLMPAPELSEMGTALACRTGGASDAGGSAHLGALGRPSNRSSRTGRLGSSISGSLRRGTTGGSVTSCVGQLPGSGPEDGAAVRPQPRLSLTDKLLVQLADASVTALVQCTQLQQLGPQGALLLADLTNYRGSSSSGSRASSSISSGGGTWTHAWHRRGCSTTVNPCAASSSSSSSGGGTGHCMLRRRGNSAGGACADLLPKIDELLLTRQANVQQQQQQQHRQAKHSAEVISVGRHSSASASSAAVLSNQICTSSSGSTTSLGGGSTSNDVLSAAQKACLLRQVSTALAAGVSLDYLLQQCDEANGYSSRAVTKQLLVQQQGLLGTWSVPRGYSRAHGSSRSSSGGAGTMSAITSEINLTPGIGSCRLSSSNRQTGGGGASSKVGSTDTAYASRLTPASAALAAVYASGMHAAQHQQQQQLEEAGQQRDLMHLAEAAPPPPQQQQHNQTPGCKLAALALQWEGPPEQWETLRQKWQRKQLLKQQQALSAEFTSLHAINRDSHSSATTWDTWTSRTEAHSIAGDVSPAGTPTAAAAAQGDQRRLAAAAFSQYSNELSGAGWGTWDGKDENDILLTISTAAEGDDALSQQAQQQDLEGCTVHVSGGKNPLFGSGDDDAGALRQAPAAAAGEEQQAAPATGPDSQCNGIADGLLCTIGKPVMCAFATEDLISTTVGNRRSSVGSVAAKMAQRPKQRTSSSSRGSGANSPTRRCSSSCSRLDCSGSNSYTVAAAAAALNAQVSSAPRACTRLHYCAACNPDGLGGVAGQSSKRSSTAYSAAQHVSNTFISSSAGGSDRSRSRSRGRDSRVSQRAAGTLGTSPATAASVPATLQDTPGEDAVAAQPLAALRTSSANAMVVVDPCLQCELQAAHAAAAHESAAAADCTAAACESEDFRSTMAGNGTLRQRSTPCWPGKSTTAADELATSTLIGAAYGQAGKKASGLTSPQHPEAVEGAIEVNSYYRPRSPTLHGLKRKPGASNTTAASSRPSSAMRGSGSSGSRSPINPTWKPAGPIATSPRGAAPLTSPRGAGKANANTSGSAGSRSVSPCPRPRAAAAAAAGAGSCNNSPTPKPHDATVAAHAPATAAAAVLQARGRSHRPSPKLRATVTADGAITPRPNCRPSSPAQMSAIQPASRSRASSPASKQAAITATALASGGTTCRPITRVRKAARTATPTAAAAAAATANVSTSASSVGSRSKRVVARSEIASSGVPGAAASSAAADADNVLYNLSSTRRVGLTTAPGATATCTAAGATARSRGQSSSLRNSLGAGSLQWSSSTRSTTVRNPVKRGSSLAQFGEVADVETSLLSSNMAHRPFSPAKHLLLSPHSSGGGSDRESVVAPHPAALQTDSFADQLRSAQAHGPLAARAMQRNSRPNKADISANIHDIPAGQVRLVKRPQRRSLSPAPPAVAAFTAAAAAAARAYAGASSSSATARIRAATAAAAAGHPRGNLRGRGLGRDDSKESGSSPYASLGGSNYDGSSGGSAAAIRSSRSRGAVHGEGSSSIGGGGRIRPRPASCSPTRPARPARPASEGKVVLRAGRPASASPGVFAAAGSALHPASVAAAVGSKVNKSCSSSRSRILWSKEAGEMPATLAAAAKAHALPDKQCSSMAITAMSELKRGPSPAAAAAAGGGVGCELYWGKASGAAEYDACIVGGVLSSAAMPAGSRTLPNGSQRVHSIHWAESAVASEETYNPANPPGGYKPTAQPSHSSSITRVACGGSRSNSSLSGARRGAVLACAAPACAATASLLKQHSGAGRKAAAAAVQRHTGQQQSLQHAAVLKEQREQTAAAAVDIEMSALPVSRLDVQQHVPRVTFHDDSTLGIISIPGPSLASVAEEASHKGKARLLQTCPAVSRDSAPGALWAGSNGGDEGPAGFNTVNSSCGGASNGAAAAGVVADGLNGILTLVKQLQGNLAGLESDMQQLHGVLHRPASRPCSMAEGSSMLGVRKASQRSELLSEVDGNGFGSRRPSGVAVALLNRNNTADELITAWKLPRGDACPGAAVTDLSAAGGLAAAPLVLLQHGYHLGDAVMEWRAARGRTASDVERWVGSQLDEACQVEREESVDITLGGAGSIAA